MKKDLLNKIIKEELISQLNEAVKLNKENMQYYALSYLKTTNTLSKISRTAYQTWMKGLKSSYTRQEAADSILNLIKDAGLLPRISKSKHQNWMKKFLGEGKLTEADKHDLKLVTKAKPGTSIMVGRDRYVKMAGNDLWVNKMTNKTIKSNAFAKI